MANTQAFCSQAKVEFMLGTHVLGTDQLKAALYLTTATVNASTTAYSATGEVSGTGYTAGGVNVTSGTAPSLSGTTAIFTPSANIVYTGVTLATAFDAMLLYNSAKSNKALSVHTFGAQTVTAGNFTVSMPANGASTALLRIA